MSWNLSTGFINKMQNDSGSSIVHTNSNTIVFTDSSITDLSNDLSVFGVGMFIRIIGGDNHNKFAKVLSSNTTTLTFKSGTFVSVSAGQQVMISAFSGGSISKILENGTIHLFSGARPGSADDSEGSSLKLAEITLNGAIFVPGFPGNGINVGVVDGIILKRAIDPFTDTIERWSALGIASGSASWGRWYDNSVSTGNSQIAIRMDGNVSTISGGDIFMPTGRDIVIDTPISATDIAITITGV